MNIHKFDKKINVVRRLITLLCAFVPIASARRKFRNSLQLWADKKMGVYMRKRIKDSDKTAIVMMDGGIGSQFVQLALGLFVKKKTGVNIKYDLSFYERVSVDTNNKFIRDFEILRLFRDLDFQKAPIDEVYFYKRYFYYRNDKFFLPNNFISNVKNMPLYLDGYYCHLEYLKEVRDEILSKLDFSRLELDEENLRVLSEIKQTNSCAVHVRRGDYVNLGWAHLTADYYLNAIKHIEEKFEEGDISLYFFSNDMFWVNDNIICRLDGNIKFQTLENNDNDKGFLDLYLMSMCKHQIISNSSFGLIGAFLNRNEDKVVIMPDRWIPVHSDKNEGSDYAYRFPDWIVMNNEGRVIS
jgi:hypothetical protein